ncbi:MULTISPECIES: hypothetical protein [unclassified Gordonia (in: high G+C Gram-positive bacteria)]
MKLTRFVSASAFAVAAAAAMAAPAHADVESIAIADPLGGSYASSCTYRVVGAATGNSPVSFLQKAPGSAVFVPVGANALPINGGVAFSWTPSTAGKYTLKLEQGSTSKEETVDVATGINLGSLCMAL